MNINRAGAFNDMSFGERKAQAVRAYTEVFTEDSPEPHGLQDSEYSSRLVAGSTNDNSKCSIAGQ